MASAARRAGCWIEVLVEVGQHVGPTVPLAAVHGPEPERFADRDLRRHLLFGTERTLLDDPGFGIRQLVDAASRALSPAINDPTTAVQAMHRVENLLARVADRPDPTGWFIDDDGTARVRLPVRTFRELARLGFTELIRYGADAPQVTRAMTASLAELRAIATPEHRIAIDEIEQLLVSAIAETVSGPFRDLAAEPDHLGLG